MRETASGAVESSVGRSGQQWLARSRAAELLLESAGGVLGVVADDLVGAGALDRREQFEGHAALINPAVASGGAHHGVLAADVVGRDRHIEACPRTGNHVQ